MVCKPHTHFRVHACIYTLSSTHSSIYLPIRLSNDPSLVRSSGVVLQLNSDLITIKEGGETDQQTRIRTRTQLGFAS